MKGIFCFLLAFASFLSSCSSDPKNADEKVWIGEALWESEKPGHGWDPRVNLTPPVKEFIRFEPVAPAHPNQLRLKFRAFGKSWDVDMERNAILMTSATRYDVRDEMGTVISSGGFPFPSNCFFIGSVRAGDGESGTAAISTCKGIRGMLTTNLNDYAIQPQNLHGVKDAFFQTHHIQIQEKPLHRANMTMPPWPRDPFHSSTRPHYRKDESPSRPLTRDDPPRPPRSVVSELAVIADKEFQERYEADFPKQKTQEDLILFLTETINWMQMWYIHPTFGYQIWFHLTQVILQIEKIDYTKYPGENGHDMLDQICHWQAAKHRDSDKWDHMIFMSDKKDVFGKRDDGTEYEGLALLGGECDRGRHCVGVKPENFQWSTWHRTVAHESGHEFGAEDDYWGESADICLNGLMRRGVFKDHEWAHCSLENYESWFPKFSCLLDSPTVPKDALIPSVAANVAFRAEAEQSSTFVSAEVWGAWKATDGPIVSPAWDSDEGAQLASCTQTTQEADPWLRITISDQFRDKPFQWFRIINRADKHEDRLSDFEVRVGDSSDFRKNKLCYTHVGAVSAAIVFQCTEPMKGKYVSVQIPGKDRILTVCEIQVFQKGADLSGKMAARHEATEEGETCRDVDADCEQKAKRGACEDERTKRRCRLSCGICVTGCWDTAKDCQERKTKMACFGEGNEQTLKECRKTCNFCGCKDTNPYCPDWAESGECVTNKEFMQVGCRKSCKACDGKPVAPPKGCVDYHSFCNNWKNAGECDANPAFMHHNCMKACNTCDAMPCMDYSECDKVASPEFCRELPNIALVCRKSCGFCLHDGREDLLDMVCYDKDPNTCTESNLEKCYLDEDWGDYMFLNCKKLCKYCTPGHPGKIIKDHPHYEDGGPSICKDQHPDCVTMGKEGQCQVQPDWMRSYCVATCGGCGGPSACADDVTLRQDCPQLAKERGCQDSEVMKARCAKTCGLC